MHEDDIHMEEIVPQILYIGPIFCFIRCATLSLLKFIRIVPTLNIELKPQAIYPTSETRFPQNYRCHQAFKVSYLHIDKEILA